ncbi:proton channel OTOP3-like [Osmerus mordax]|uniref:proton channel OTOP3-like n=1 Tax=Osmerus mordax TaxID=8014 RepID=UPI00350EA71A
MVSEAGVSWGKDLHDEEDPRSEEDSDPDGDPVLVWVPSGRRLISGLLGLNVVLLGAALVAGQAFNPEALKHQEPLVFILLLMGLSMGWMLWYLLWARKKPGRSPHKDHHAGGSPIRVVLLLFAVLSLLLHVFRMGYAILMKECSPAAKVIFPFVEAPFLGLQMYFIWAHSKDCIHKHKIITRSGLMVTLSADLLLWLHAISEDTVHQEIELEKDDYDEDDLTNTSYRIPMSSGVINATLCKCSASAVCLVFRKGYEVLYPFNIEFYLMAGCMLYVMWKNVGRRVSPGPHPPHGQKLTLHIVREGGILFGPLLGFLVLVAGVTSFVLYQVWVGQRQHRTNAFLIFYGYHLAVMPVMSICCLAGMLVHKLERRATEGGHNPTRSLDVLLLVGAALGQLGLSYFCVVAALALGTSGALGSLDLAYSLLSLLELLLQNIFIIEGLHRHPSLALAKSKERKRSSIFKLKRKDNGEMSEVSPSIDICMAAVGSASPPPAEKQGGGGKAPWTKRAMQEICAFLILSNIMLWVIPAFGANPQFENGLGKKFFGFTSWFVLVNLGQPLGVFYRMHSVGALVELLITA